MACRHSVLDLILRHRLTIAVTMREAPKTTLRALSTSAVGMTYSRTLPSVVKGRHQVVPRPTIQHQIIRWKQSGKVKKTINALEEMAHRPEREAAQERRQKKKDKKSKRKGKKGAAADEPAEIVEEDIEEENNDDEWGLDDDDDDDEEEEGLEDEEPSLADPAKVKEKMTIVVQKFQESLKSIRGAEPTAEIFDDIQVNAYGAMTPLKAVGQVVIASPTLAQITCFDPSVSKDVAKAVQLALELNPEVEEHGMVKVPLPRVSMDVRQQTAKQLKKKAESCKQRIRQVRRKAMDLVKKGKDGKIPGVSKDDAFANGKEIDTVAESMNETLKEIVEKKMDSIMAV